MTWERAVAQVNITPYYSCHWQIHPLSSPYFSSFSPRTEKTHSTYDPLLKSRKQTEPTLNNYTIDHPPLGTDRLFLATNWLWLTEKGFNYRQTRERAVSEGRESTHVVILLFTDEAPSIFGVVLEYLCGENWELFRLAVNNLWIEIYLIWLRHTIEKRLLILRDFNEKE